MWLAFDIGNSATKGAIFDGEHLVQTFRYRAEDADSPERLAKMLLLSIEGRPVSRAGCVSVVPSRTDSLATAMRRVTGLELQRFDTHSALPFKLLYETPETLGSDRLAAAVAAFGLYGNTDDGSPRPVIAVDAGTAVTCEVVTIDGRYLGGTIAPGPSLLRDSLDHGTAQLPLVDLSLPEHPVGRSTREAMRSGLMYGYIDAVSQMLNRLSETLEETPFVVATGGWGEWLSEHISSIDALNPNLVLQGVRILMALEEG